MKHAYLSLLVVAMIAAFTINTNQLHAQHFQFPGGGLTGQQWSIFIAGATLNGENLVAGDEIAVFDGETMVGAFVLTKVCTPDNAFDNGLTAFSVLADESPGYTSGNPVTFKCWQASMQVEAIIWEADWTDPYDDAWAEPTFPAGANNYSLPLISFEHTFTGNISGTVTGNMDAQPIEGALLKIIETGDTFITQDDGSFEFLEIATGTCSLAAYASGYFTDTITGVEVAADQTAEIDIELNKILATLTGTVTDEDGVPIEGATVKMNGAPYSTQSLTNGAYQIEQVPEGTYDIECLTANYFRETAENVVLVNQETIVQDFTLVNSGTQKVPLKQGFSFVSSYILDDEPNMTDVLGEALDNLNYARDAHGNSLVKFGPNWVNGIGDWTPQEGYLFKMNNPDTAILCGAALNTFRLSLNSGFNIVPHMYHQPKDALDVFGESLDNLDFVRDSEGNLLIKFGENWLNGIGSMQPGQGYLVKMNAPDTIQFKEFECGDLLYDERDGQYYETVQIDEQCWMAENMNIGERIDGGVESTDNGIIEKYCYGDNPTNCDDYGGLYQWDEMMNYIAIEGIKGICPEGWHIPKDDEWKVLEGFVDSLYPINDPEWDNTGFRGFDVGMNLKSTSEWLYNGNGIDLFGFSALPGGGRGNSNQYAKINRYGYWWSSSECNTSKSWFRYLYSGSKKIGRYDNDKTVGVALRCLKGNYSGPPIFDLSLQASPPNSGALIGNGQHPSGSKVILAAQSLQGWDFVNWTDEDGIEISSLPDFEYLMPAENITLIANFIEGQIDFICGDSIVDIRDGKEYATVQIGDQCWMAENMNIGERIDGLVEMTDNSTIEKYCNNDNSANCEIYGGLYQWDEMMQYISYEGTIGICPLGWHLPSDTEWDNFEGYLGSQPEYYCDDHAYNIAKALAATTYWSSSSNSCAVGNGMLLNNSTGFSGLPGSNRKEDGTFYPNGYFGYWWSSTESSVETATLRMLTWESSGISNVGYGKGMGFSVRCIWDYSIPNGSPSYPENESPINGSLNQSIQSVLTWTCSDPENNPLTFDIKFSTEFIPLTVATGISDTFYTPGTLEYSTTYFWQIVAHDNQGNKTIGGIWSFTTMDEPWQCGDTLVDERDGQQYATVQIGEQCWMAENLNVGERINGNINMEDNGTIEKYCYNNNPNDCEIYGGLYQWDEIMDYSLNEGSKGICPEGWIIPTDNQWCNMTTYLDASVECNIEFGWSGIDVGNQLKESGNDHWFYGNTGATNSSGFTGLPGGWRDVLYSFTGIGTNAIFWTSTEKYDNTSYNRSLYVYNETIGKNHSDRNTGFSARCILASSALKPFLPSNPNPDNNSYSTNNPNQLSWSCSDPANDPLTYDVYFGTEANPPQVATGIIDTFYTPGVLENATTYYWQIVAHDDQGKTTEGELWTFTTFTNPDWQCGDTLVDTRDGNTYSTVQIGEQCWMAENLSYLPSVSPSSQGSGHDPYYYVHGYQGSNLTDAKSTSNYQTYGVLYNRPAAISACPEEWYLPTNDVWAVLTDFLSSQPEYLCDSNPSYIAKSLASTTNWHYSTNLCAIGNNQAANNATGFSGPPGGARSNAGSFENLNYSSYWWTNTNYSATYVLYRQLVHAGEIVNQYYGSKALGLSIRCVRD